MNKKIKNIVDLVYLFWIFGGGFFIGLLCFVFAWKLAIVTLCIWACSCIIALLIYITKS